jgi:hypothetical protein
MKQASTYPAWHETPFRLTNEQLENPLSIIETFCWEYPLAEIRMVLWEWFVASTSDENANIRAIVTLYENLDKLIEAIHWITPPKK